MIIDSTFNEMCSKPSDINTHLQRIVSTWAFLRGLLDGPQNNKKKLLCVDLEHIDFDLVQRIACDVGIDLKFIQSDSATVKLPHQRRRRLTSLTMMSRHTFASSRRHQQDHLFSFVCRTKRGAIHRCTFALFRLLRSYELCKILSPQVWVSAYT